jgi:hypothetical protein
MSEFRHRALLSMDRVLDGRTDVASFCAEYETLYNFDREAAEVEGAELQVFSDLFDVVTSYSPFPEERQRIPRYKDEVAVIDAVRIARARISDGTFTA